MLFRGNILSMYSKGTNDLIKEGAKPFTEIKDILEDFSWILIIFII